MTREAAALPWPCYIVAEVNAMNRIKPQPVNRAGYM
jgi:hypothetical protein